MEAWTSINVQKQALNLSWFILLGLIGYGIYSAGVRINYYADDFQWYFDPPPSSIFHYFWHRNPYEHQAYRPLQASFLILVQRFWGLETLAIHLTLMGLHILLSWLIWQWMVSYGFTLAQAVLGSLFMLSSQANAIAVLSVDTVSQVSGALFGCMSLWLLYYSLSVIGHSDKQPHRAINCRYYVLSIFVFTLALLSKETSIAFFGIALCIILYKNAKMEQWFSWIRQTVLEITPYLVIVALYFGIRSVLELKGPTFSSDSSGRYEFHFGLNIVQNFSMFIFQAFLPVSSADVFIFFKNKEFSLLSITLIIWFIFSSVFTYGLIRSRCYLLLSLLSICAIIALFPTVLMNHISELYLYNSMPFFSILVGVGVGKLITLSKYNRMRCSIIAAAVTLLLIINVLAIQSKAQLMKVNGERAALLLSQIMPYIRQINTGGRLILLNPVSDEVEYSVFRMSGFNVLGLERLQQLSGGADVKVEIIPQSKIDLNHVPYNAVVLALDEETGNITQINRALPEFP